MDCFVHVPKSGGTSVEQAFRLQHAHRRANCSHSIAIIRDPIDRLASAYHFCKRPRPRGRRSLARRIEGILTFFTIEILAGSTNGGVRAKRSAADYSFTDWSILPGGLQFILRGSPESPNSSGAFYPLKHWKHWSYRFLRLAHLLPNVAICV